MTTLVTARDLEVFQALARTPLTARQLLKVSQAFREPFTSERCVRERLGVLCAAGRVRRWFYATADRGALGYYVLSRHGHQILLGYESTVPHRIGKAIAVAQQSHTRALAEFIVHTVVTAYRSHVPLTEFSPENALRLRLAEESQYPDCAFQLAVPDGRTFQFFVELDNGTQSVHSAKDFESWERKLRFYDRYQDQVSGRFRVLLISTRSLDRLGHLLTLAASIGRLPQRSLCYGVTLAQYLASPQPLTTPCFKDHRGSPVTLAPAATLRPRAVVPHLVAS